MIKFVYFDIGGVLINHSKAFASAASKFNLDIEDIGSVFDENHDEITKGLIVPHELWNKCIKKYDLKNAQNYDFLKSWMSDYQPIRETHELVIKLSNQFKIGLLSNIYKGMLPLLLREGKIPDIQYKQIIFSCDVGMMKQNKGIYELAQRRCGCEPETILFVDDQNERIKIAKSLGWKTFRFDTNNPIASCNRLEKVLDLE